MSASSGRPRIPWWGRLLIGLVVLFVLYVVVVSVASQTLVPK
jgi:hypothetical protein